MSATCCDETLAVDSAVSRKSAPLEGEPKLNHRLYQAGIMLAVLIFLLSFLSC